MGGRAGSRNGRRQVACLPLKPADLRLALANSIYVWCNNLRTCISWLRWLLLFLPVIHLDHVDNSRIITHLIWTGAVMQNGWLLLTIISCDTSLAYRLDFRFTTSYLICSWKIFFFHDFRLPFIVLRGRIWKRISLGRRFMIWLFLRARLSRRLFCIDLNLNFWILLPPISLFAHDSTFRRTLSVFGRAILQLITSLDLHFNFMFNRSNAFILSTRVRFLRLPLRFRRSHLEIFIVRSSWFRPTRRRASLWISLLWVITKNVPNGLNRLCRDLLTGRISGTPLLHLPEINQILLILFLLSFLNF